jgi:acyl carrier protein
MERVTRTDVESRIRRVLAARLGIAAGVLARTDASTPLIGRGLGLDSVEALNLAAGIETEFGIAIEDRELTLALFQNLASLTDFVVRRVAAASV